MAAAPHPTPHLEQHLEDLEQSPEQRRAADIIRLLTLYRPLLDAFVIDFFTEGLWAQLPPAWQPALASATPPQLARLLQGCGGPGAAWPLSLLAFAAAARALAFPRGCPGASSRPPCQSSHLHPLLRRHVKPKKQHEIWCLGKVSAPPVLQCPQFPRCDPSFPQTSNSPLSLQLLRRLSQATGCEHVVDIGAGQVRAGDTGGPRGSPHPGLTRVPPPGPPLSVPGFWPRSLSTAPQPPGCLPGYPLSASVAALPGHQLSYRAREAACHALEEYEGRLRGGSAHLRAHCYRAALESLIRAADPAKKHLGVQPGRKAHALSFSQYAQVGLPLAGLDPAEVPLDSGAVGAMLEQQHKVVAFCTLGQLLAPAVETLVLLDRLLYLREQGFHCALVPLFNPRFSPRNLVLVAARTPLDVVLARLDEDSEDGVSSEDEDPGGAEPPREGQS
ncbi:RRNAD protein, partial [Climacteris rufus]|nr:RRNAD protein [Climacteris rufus]